MRWSEYPAVERRPCSDYPRALLVFAALVVLALAVSVPPAMRFWVN